MKFFPGAREAQLKYGGNFPYLACADDVNLHLEVENCEISHQPFVTSSVIKPCQSINNLILQK